MSRHRRALCWFRRDLRDYDHAALYHALASAEAVWCAFVFDTDILDPLPREDRRVAFIHAALVELEAALRARGGGLVVRHGRATEEIPRLAAELDAGAVFANRDYEPAAIARDAEVARALRERGCAFETFKDQVVFEKEEVRKQAGGWYTVFTPYRNAWLKRVTPQDLAPYPVGSVAQRLAPPPEGAGVPTLEDIGFRPAGLAAPPPGMSGARRLLEDFAAHIDRYHAARDFPAAEGSSRLSPHLRFGTLSIREAARLACGREGEGARTWLSELIWRDFFSMILQAFPHVDGHAFRREFGDIAWPGGDGAFVAWCEGRTGYPLVDAAMRQLAATGWMHNRLRMVAASFLVKDLLVDWRRGERWFALKLLDYDLASNNGGWQWAASTGCDAQPWFRIFNPVTQSRKFDPEGRFIRRYVPELAGCDARTIHEPWIMSAEQQRAAGVEIGRDYPAPVVDHAEARQKALALYNTASEKASHRTQAGTAGKAGGLKQGAPRRRR